MLGLYTGGITFKYEDGSFVSVRPFGSTVLLGIYDEVEGPQLYGIDPSGTAIKFKGIAVGNRSNSNPVEDDINSYRGG